VGINAAMIYLLLADLVVLLHVTFVAFAGLGGLFVPRYPKILWLHLPALLWGVIVQWADLICPLTPLENLLRGMGGEDAYAGAFIAHYLGRLLYPEALTPQLRYWFGALLIIVNAMVYARLLHRFRSARGRSRN
jgi:hypothetical protein